MGFRRLRSVPLPYAIQGRIYFTCLNYATESLYTRRRIDRLLEETGGDYAQALREMMVKGRGIQEISLKHNVSVETLQRCRRGFYLAWGKEG